MPNITIYLSNKEYADFIKLEDNKRIEIKTKLQTRVKELLNKGI